MRVATLAGSGLIHLLHAPTPAPVVSSVCFGFGSLAAHVLHAEPIAPAPIVTIHNTLNLRHEPSAENRFIKNRYYH